MQDGSEIAVVEWAKRIPVGMIPAVLACLTTRLLAEGDAGRDQEPNGSSAAEPERLLTAGEIAKHLSVPESWVRNEERRGRIPGVRIGKYVRFRASEIERKLALQTRK
ncbi:MAG TPA: helix-turn-helix domain-containing protein [Candidatus Binataceae bacterium]|nr:helix-turn-helix domain-containing protein [Candidatus Binataceae bacterium]